MMNCCDFQKSIYEEVFTHEVQQHIRSCSSCANLMHRLSVLQGMLQYQVRGSEDYQENRKQLILQKVEHLKFTGTFDWSTWMLRTAYVLALGGMLFLLISRFRQTDVQVSSAHRTTEITFEVGKRAQSVELRWKGDSRKTYRVYKGSSPKQLEPVGEFRGLQWVDSSQNTNGLVFYKIEAL
jgi:hypothetical protein